MNKNSQPTVTIRQVSCDDEFYKSIVEDLSENRVEPQTLASLLYGPETRSSSPRLLAIAEEDQCIGYVITFDFFQATYITHLHVRESFRRKGYGTMLLSHVCSNPNRTYLLLSEVAMSDSDQLAACVHRKIFLLKNGFRNVPFKRSSPYYANYDVHIKGPDIEPGSLLAALRKSYEIWNTAYFQTLCQDKPIR